MGIPAADSDCGSEVYSEEFHSDSDAALGIEELEREVPKLLEHIPGNLKTDSDPELNDKQQPSTFAAPLAGTPTGTSKWYTDNYPLRRKPLLCVQADLKRREIGREGFPYTL